MARQDRAARDGGSRSNLYDDITGKIIAELEEGRLPWVQPWGTSATKAPLAMPRNASTGRQYSGINVLILWGAVVQHGYQAQLGPPWFVLFGVPVYYPPALFWWWYFYEAYAPPIFARGGIIAASGGFIAIAVAIGTSVWRAREARNVATYGSARWAEKSEIREAGLLDPDGVVLGRFEKDYLRHDGPEHVLCFAPNPHEGMDL